METPATFPNGNRRGVSAFESQGLCKEAALKIEAEIFNLLLDGQRPEPLAVKYRVTVPTVYAIDKRESKRRGVSRVLASRKKKGPDASAKDLGPGESTLPPSPHANLV